MAIRDIGRLAVETMPRLEGFARRVYRSLPAALHDTPTRRIARFFEGETSVAFVQIGAYDGVAGDPLRAIILEREGFHGVLVEPQPKAFEALRRNYADQTDRVKLWNGAVGSGAGQRRLFRVSATDPRNAGLPEWAWETASFDEAHVLKHFPSAVIEAISIRTATFSEIAASLPSGHVDLVVIDVEGYERPIIESIDLDRHGIRFLMYEHKHLPREDLLQIGYRFRRAGFTLKPFGRDTIAWRS